MSKPVNEWTTTQLETGIKRWQHYIKLAKAELKKRNGEKTTKKKTNAPDVTKNGMKAILDENKITYNKLSNKDALLEVVRKNNLVKKAEQKTAAMRAMNSQKANK